ncbi:MAG: hypothetical protein J3R72DRAFT_369018 [Linnemannia gamsii]|nr:MAG: hypothetical protein J3R72DRAFT_369018 [Linnemannia gamsii]
MAILWVTLIIIASLSGSALAEWEEAPTPGTLPLDADKCIAACKLGDVICKTYCIIIPSPDNYEVIVTIVCAKSCSQGDEFEEDTKLYAACQ